MKIDNVVNEATMKMTTNNHNKLSRTDAASQLKQQQVNQIELKTMQENKQNSKSMELNEMREKQNNPLDLNKSQDKKITEEEKIVEAIQKANKKIESMGRKLEFAVHEGTHEVMVKVINTNDDSVIREIPSEKVLDMAEKMYEIAGLLVDEKR